MEFKEKLKFLRNEKMLSQQELADRLEIRRSTISNYEQGRNYPTNDILIKLCDFFGVSADVLLNDKYDTRALYSQLLKKEDIENGSSIKRYIEENNLDLEVELEKFGITSKDLNSLSNDAKQEIKNFVDFIRSKYGKKN